MSNTVKKKVKVIEAQYVREADSILIVGECDEGRLRQQIHSDCFSFGNKNKVEEMSKTAEMMIGHEIWMVFDPDLVEKIKGHDTLNY